MSSWSYSDLIQYNWSSIPGDIIASIVPYLSAWEVLNLCLYNDTFNRRACQNQNSIVWKLLYQRDISEKVPTDHTASRCLDIMDDILPLTPDQRLSYGAKNGYNEIVKSALQDGAKIHAEYDLALRYAAMKGRTETVKVLLDRGANIHAIDDLALRLAAENALGPGAKTHTETVKLLLDHGADLHTHYDDALRRAAGNGRPRRLNYYWIEGRILMLEMIMRFIGQHGMEIPRQLGYYWLMERR